MNQDIQHRDFLDMDGGDEEFDAEGAKADERVDRERIDAATGAM